MKILSINCFGKRLGGSIWKDGIFQGVLINLKGASSWHGRDEDKISSSRLYLTKVYLSSPIASDGLGTNCSYQHEMAT